MPLILGTNSIKDTGYDVANSIRFDEASTTFLSKASFGTPTSTKKSTVSFWCKRSLIEEGIIFMNDSNTFPIAKIYFTSAHTFSYIEFDPSVYLERTTNAVFKDLSAWSHFVVAVDTTQGTADNRVKIYHNGTQITSFSASTTPAQDSNVIINNNLRTGIGGTGSSGGDGFEGYVAELVRIDGQALDPTSFGEFDEDSNIWKPKDVSGLTFGTNGFYLDFENSAELGTDVSGASNTFTENNLTAEHQSTDTCTNNFATFNPLFPTAGTSAFSEGNLKLVASGSAGSGLSSFGLSKGKWYMEVKQTAVNEPLGNGESGICVVGDPTGNLGNVEGTAFAYGIRNHNGTKFENTSTATSWHGNWTAGDIISVALDMDNHRVYFAKNGQYADGSGNWDEAFTGSPAHISLSTAKTDYFLAMSQLHSSATETYELNFGSPSFSISSGNSDADGHGNFEYSVPSGYFALNTKNLSEYG